MASHINSQYNESEEDQSDFRVLTKRKEYQQKHMLAELKRESQFRAPKVPNPYKNAKPKFLSDKNIDEIDQNDHYFNQRYYEEKQNLILNKYHQGSASETRNSTKSIPQFMPQGVENSDDFRSRPKENSIFNIRKLSHNDIQSYNNISQEHSPIPAARKMKDQTGINKDSKEMHKNYATTHKGVFSHLSVYKVKSTKNICSDLIKSNESRPESKEVTVDTKITPTQKLLIDKIKNQFKEINTKNVTVLPNKKKDLSKTFKNKIIKSADNLDVIVALKYQDNINSPNLNKSIRRDEEIQIPVEKEIRNELHQVTHCEEKKDVDHINHLAPPDEAYGSDLCYKRCKTQEERLLRNLCINKLSDNKLSSFKQVDLLKEQISIKCKDDGKVANSQPTSTKCIMQILQESPTEVKAKAKEIEVNVDQNIKQSELKDIYYENVIKTPTNQNTERIIAESIAKLAQIAELENENDIPSPSPKIVVGPTNTWGRKDSNLDSTSKELMDDFSTLELKYRLKTNWLENEDEVEKPFTSNISAIYTKPDIK